MACCPVHDDKNPSMAIKDDGDKILIRCFGCGAGAHEIVEAIGLTLNDLFSGDQQYYQKPDKVPAKDLLECVRNEALIIYIAACRMSRGENDLDFERIKYAAKVIETAYEESIK